MSERTENNIEMIRKNGLEAFVWAVPDAIDQLTDMLQAKEVPANIKALLIQMILERGLGKPEETVNMTVKNADMEAAYAAVDRMVEEIRRSEEEKKNAVALKKSSTQ